MIKTCRVLVIDADAVFGAHVRDQLRAEGHEVGLASKVRTGLQRAAAWSPDVVVVDAALPDGAGLDVLRAIRASKDDRLSGVRVVLTTATPSDRDRLQAAIEGALDYVTKPVEPRELSQRIHQCLAAGPEPEVRRRIQVTALRVLAAMEAEEGSSDAIPDPFDVRPRPRPKWARLDPATQGHPATPPDHVLPNVLLTASVGTLSARQQYLVAIIGETDTLAEAAERLGVSPSALSARVRAVTTRLGLAHPGELVALARRNQVLDASVDALYGVDPDGTCVFANRAAAELLGYTREELIGQDVHALIHHSHPDGSPMPMDDCPIHQALCSGEPRIVGEDVFWRRDGAPVFISYTVVPAAEGGERMGAVVSVRDVSPRVQAAKAIESSTTGMAMALEAVAITTFEVDLRTGLSTRSDNFETMLGLELGSVSPAYADFLALVHPEDQPKLRLDHLKTVDAGHMFIREYRLVLPSGEQRHFRSRARLLPDALGQPTRLVGIALDVTDQHEQRIVRQLILDSSTDAFVAMDTAGLVTEWNAAAERTFLFTRDEAIGRPMVELIIPSRYRQSHTEAIARVLANPPSATVSRGPTEMTGVRADGIELPVEISFTTVSLGGTLTFTAFIRDISRRKEMEATLARQAVTDQLTGLPNRTLLEDRVAQGIARMGAERSLSVLFIDVDHLKVVNDSLSHLAGDQVLRQVAARLCANATPADTVARFGGDTFAFVSEVGSEHNATALATRLLRALEAPMVIEGRELRVTVSIGIALADRRDAAHLSLLGDADAAMYRAKERGRGRAELFDDAMRQRALARLDMEGELRHAIESGELRLQYQPVMDLACETVKGVEALVRWEHPTRGLVPPAEFIPLAEETGLIVPLGTWVLRTACAQLASWCCQPGDAAAGLTMAVNLSGRQLAQPDLVDMVAGIVAETGIDPARLCLEITESVLMEESAGIALVRLHDLGVRLAVDDFGTGYSSLLYLRRFPVDTLKLDQYFVSGLGHNAQDTTIVRATIDLAHALGLVALAEGVEEPEQREVLRTMGCDLGQGFLWSRPVAAEQITRLLTAGVRTMAV